MKTNAIIAGMPLDQGMVEMTTRCIQGFRPLFDKITFIQNGKFENEYPKEMLDLVDTYIVNKNNRLHGGAINQGALIAQKDEFLAFINDDITPESITREGIQEMCIPGAMVSPQLLVRMGPGKVAQVQSYQAHASFWIMDKETFLKVGLWNLSLKHIADVDFFDRAVALGVPMFKNDKYTVNHDHPAATIHRVIPPEFSADEI